jgi:hypothetical protein
MQNTVRVACGNSLGTGLIIQRVARGVVYHHRLRLTGVPVDCSKTMKGIGGWLKVEALMNTLHSHVLSSFMQLNGFLSRNYCDVTITIDARVFWLSYTIC